MDPNPGATRAAIRAGLESTREPFHALLGLLTEDDWRRQSLNPGWTNGEILAHMVFASKLAYVYLGFGLFLVVLAVAIAVERSRLGYFLTAFRENEDAARALGVKTGQVRLIAMALSAFLSAVAGTFYAQYVVYIDPSGVSRLQLSVQVALFAIVGGLGTFSGPIIGACIFVPITIALRSYLGTTAPGLHMIIYGLILVLTMLYMPKGLYGTLKAKMTARAKHESRK